MNRGSFYSVPVSWIPAQTNKNWVVQKIEAGIQCRVCVVWPGLEALPTALLHRRRRFNDYLMQRSWKAVGYQAPKRGGGGDGSTVAKVVRTRPSPHKNDLAGVFYHQMSVGREVNSDTGEYKTKPLSLSQSLR